MARTRFALILYFRMISKAACHILLMTFIITEYLVQILLMQKVLFHKVV